MPLLVQSFSEEISHQHDKAGGHACGANRDQIDPEGKIKGDLIERFVKINSEMRKRTTRYWRIYGCRRNRSFCGPERFCQWWIRR